jgi:hypothetical protein
MIVSLTTVPPLHVVAVIVVPVPATRYHRFLKGPADTPHGVTMSSVAAELSRIVVEGTATLIAPSHSSFVGGAGQGHSMSRVISPVENESKDATCT